MFCVINLFNNNKMDAKLDYIIQTQKEIMDRLDDHEQKINDILGGTKKMESHITFIDSIYNQIRTPFHFIMDSVSTLKQSHLLE